MNDKKIEGIVRLFQSLNVADQRKVTSFLIELLKRGDDRKHVINENFKHFFGKTLGPYDQDQCECCGK